MKKFKFQLETLLRVTRRKKDDAERDFDAGLGIDDDDAWDDLEEELALEKQQELEMAGAV